VKSRRGRIFRSCDRTRQNKDRRREGEMGIGLADTKMYQGHSEVFRVGELLSSIYRRFCIYSQTSTQHGEKRSEVGLNKEAGRSV